MEDVLRMVYRTKFLKKKKKNIGSCKQTNTHRGSSSRTLDLVTPSAAWRRRAGRPKNWRWPSSSIWPGLHTPASRGVSPLRMSEFQLQFPEERMRFLAIQNVREAIFWYRKTWSMFAKGYVDFILYNFT